MSVQILTATQTKQKIRRLAYQLYENYFEQAELHLVGIESMGLYLAEMLQKNLQEISSLRVHLESIRLQKSSPLSGDVCLSKPIELLSNQNIILIDDVLNSGKTLFYALQPFFQIPIQRLQTLVLINRDHTNFPINPDYAGYSLATTLHNHVSVVLDDELTFGVYLS